MLSFSRSARAALALLIVAVCGLCAPLQAHARAHRSTLHVLELYTAQGCSGCAEADLALKSFADRKGLVVLTFPVDYWDYLGWKDTFALPEFTQRQATYKTRFRLRETYSPQLVIDGHSEGAGVDAARIEAVLKSTPPRHVRVRLTGGRVRVTGAAPTAGADVWLIHYDPQDQSVQVKAGENRGKTVIQKNVVRTLTRIGRWHGADQSFALPAAETASLRTVVLVQGPRGGDILGVAQK